MSAKWPGVRMLSLMTMLATWTALAYCEASVHVHARKQHLLARDKQRNYTPDSSLSAEPHQLSFKATREQGPPCSTKQSDIVGDIFQVRVDNITHQVSLAVKGWGSTQLTGLLQPALSHHKIVSAQYDGKHKGEDFDFGEFVVYDFSFVLSKGAYRAPVQHSVRHYTCMNVVEFTSRFPEGLRGFVVTDIAGASEEVSVAFAGVGLPESHKAGSPRLGFISIQDIFGQSCNFGVFDAKEFPSLFSPGTKSGLVGLFDEDMSAGVVLSASSSFMTSSMAISDKSELLLGLMGSIEEIPAGFEMSFVAAGAAGGMPAAWRTWGSFLRAKYAKPEATLTGLRDPTASHIGYSTDHGAYYYYRTMGAAKRDPAYRWPADFKPTHAALKAYADRADIPYKYILLDSWWYIKDKKRSGFPHTGEATMEWRADQGVYPRTADGRDGMVDMFERTAWPVQGHNRFWSAQTPYATHNGGQYSFIVEPATSPSDHGLGLPQDASFWEHLLAEAKEWGLVVYEQDWLNMQFDCMKATLTNVSVARKWLNDMAAAAARHGLAIQYSMPYPRHMLQSLEAGRAVTNIRASNDYLTTTVAEAGSYNWKIGFSSPAIWALGALPCKDSFWSARTMPGNDYGQQEPNSALHGIVATFSTGPVQVSDGIGMSDRPLILRSCDAAGRILKPSTPLAAIAASYLGNAFHRTSPHGDEFHGMSDADAALHGVRDPNAVVGEVWESASLIPFAVLTAGHVVTASTVTFAHVFAAHLHHNFSLTPAHLSTLEPRRYYFYQSDLDDDAASINRKYDSNELSAGTPIRLTEQQQRAELDPVHHQLFLITPALQGGWVIIGERDKWVMVSPIRILNITVEAPASTDIEVRSRLSVTMQGAPGERVRLALWNQNQAGKGRAIQSLRCTVAAAGTASAVCRSDAREQRLSCLCDAPGHRVTPGSAEGTIV